MITDEIREELFALQDTGYRDFQSKLIPSSDPEHFIGVRTPELRKLAKAVVSRDDCGVFLGALPHSYFDENQLHAFIISEMKSFDDCISALEAFLPFVDNWATCDQMSPKVFRKHKEDLLSHIKQWIASDECYTIRFGIGMLMEHFLDSDFDSAYPELVASVESDEYYVNMMRAWYFATALAKQNEAVLPYISEQRLDTWTHNKTISKAIESYRIDQEQKQFLRSLKRS